MVHRESAGAFEEYAIDRILRDGWPRSTAAGWLCGFRPYAVGQGRAVANNFGEKQHRFVDILFDDVIPVTEAET